LPHPAVVIENAGVVAMLLTDTGFALVEDLGRQTDVPSVLASFQRIVVAFGMRAFCIGDPSNPQVKRPGRRWDGSWPADVYRHYASLDLFRIDPTVTRINESPAPFRWSETHARATPQQRRVLHELADVGGRDGLAVPIHGPGGAIAGVSIGTDKYDLSRQDEVALHMASFYLHGRLTAIRAQAPARPARVLTPRERECLEWVAGGKTDWEISQILGISEQTVHGYVQNAMTKLGARTRAQAVALAMQSSQIQP
jgi:DNA-binding CsgD family transcriptional regulator